MRLVGLLPRNGGRRLPARAQVAFAVLAALGGAGMARDGLGDVDPTIARRLIVGKPTGASPMHRVDRERTGRTPSLPVDPWVERRARLAGGVDVAPAVDGEGRLIVATDDGGLVQLDRVGRLEWSVPLGAAAEVGPVLTSDGTRVVVTERGRVVGVTPAGALRFDAALDGPRRTARAAPACTDDGAILLASGARLARVGPDGAVQATTTVDGSIVAIAARGRDVFIVTEAGAVFAWRAPAPARRIGSFRGRPAPDVAMLDPRTLLTVVNETRLSTVDVRSGEAHVVATSGKDAFVFSPALVTSGSLRVATRGGWLVGFEGGHEASRLPLSTGGSATALSGGSAPATDPLVTASGSAAIMTAAGVLVVALPSGEIRSATIEGCSSPVALVPSGPRQVVVVCRSGLVAWVGDHSGAGVSL